jgi:hypothetical protein
VVCWVLQSVLPLSGSCIEQAPQLIGTSACISADLSTSNCLINFFQAYIISRYSIDTLFPCWSFLHYSLIGSLNKIPMSIAGILLFKIPVSVPNLFSILFGKIFSHTLVASLSLSIC